MLSAVLGTGFDLPWRPVWEQHEVADQSRPVLQLTGHPAFDYPWSLRKAGIEGSVGLLLKVLPDGSVASVVVSESSGSQLLNLTTIRSAELLHFRPWPASWGPGKTQLVVHFKLENSNPEP